ncbi:uncharacterized protein LOC114856729 isoform X2 [Betta splendens]|uniref:Uncharacterized protein LOC114856729 isoform X2 n=1 Tax=Betta splendens TaxID=158456 RepID=A0A6P7MNC0_BETSP|nr:uncharacterized protein LOC114856729 isoform X2 [Betta splendens]
MATACIIHNPQRGKRGAGKLCWSCVHRAGVSIRYGRRPCFPSPSSVDLCQSVGMSAGAELSSEDASRFYRNAGGARAAMEKLYWDLQLLNVGNLDRLCPMHQSTHPDRFPTRYDPSDSEPSQSVLHRRVRRLKRAARHCWAELASEGLRTMVPSPWQGGRPGVKVHAWGRVSPPDLVFLVEVKYDVVARLLFTEMLQEHHTLSSWQSLLPWQQHKEHEGLEELAEEVLLSGDMLHLAELPGAFRIYRACQGESEEQSWSAMSLLYELRACREHERDAITALGERLDRESLRLLCSHIRLATLRAQRESTSQAALMAARQSWEAWPHINSPCRRQQALLWLQAEEEETNEDVTSASPQQHSVLQLLVLSQEQERRHLVRLVHGLSPEDLQGDTAPAKEEGNQQAALRKGCINRLRELHDRLQTQNETRAPLEQADLARGSEAQPQMSSNPAMWSQHQVEACALLLLTHLLELQEAQASALLSGLTDMSVQQIQVLQAKYERDLQAQSCANLLQLLEPDAPLNPGSLLMPASSIINHSSSDRPTTPEPPEPHNSSDEPAHSLQYNSASVQAADGTVKQDVCTGCGAVMEELPYLEISCMGKEAEEEEDGSMRAQSYEKQGSLITLAWSRPPDGGTDCEAESADGVAAQSESATQTRVQSSDISSTAEHTQSDETSAESYDEEAAEQQRSPHGKLTSEEGPAAGQTDKEEAVSGCDLQTHTPPPLFDLPEAKPHSHQPTPASSSEIGTDGDMVESSPAIQSDSWDSREPDPTGAEEQENTLQTRAACGLAERETLRESTVTEREQIREQVSAVERERTMRNLVDMQKRAEQRHQRDRERQRLRVQERLSIIQNKKTEKDLLGLKHMEQLKHLTQDLPREDKQQQKTVVRERLEQLRRERSHLMQSKRDRNTAGFKELLGPVTLYRETEDTTD